MTVDRPGTMHERRPDGEVWAAIDLGTNSFHLLVARVDPAGGFDVLAREKDVVRLGSGSGDMDELTPAAMDRGIATLARFGQIAATFGAEISAVATSALREARNRDVFVQRALDEAGIDIDVVSGSEEARLIHLGVIQSVPLFDQRIVVVDIGGGSTEFVVAEGDEVFVARSTKLGAIRLTDRFFPDGVIRGKSVRECRNYIRSFLVPTLHEVRSHAPYVAVGSSGTIVTLARMIAARQGRDPLVPVNGVAFARADLEAVVDDLIERKTPDDRSDIAGLDDKRQDIVVAGALLLEQILEGLEVTTMTVSEAALREGILVDRTRSPGESIAHLGDIRLRSVERMAEQFHEDPAHIGRATALALQLFDGLLPLHGLRQVERDFLEAAGLLHNVGLFISHAAHHKHSYYVIRNSDQLAGFTDREIEIIAQVARYHRKSQPKPSHSEFQSLRSADQDLVRLLAGILRVGIALDRTRRSVVDRIDVTAPDPASDDPVLVHVCCDDEADISLELYTAHQRTGLLERALGRPVELRFVSARPIMAS